MPKKPTKLKPGFVLCPDCGVTYKDWAPHLMFCPAHTCDGCGTSYVHVIEPDKQGTRICERCLEGDDDEDGSRDL